MWKFPNICTALMLAAGLLMATGQTTKSEASTQTTLYPFCSSTGCDDGSNAQSALLKHGNKLYGVAGGGGTHGHGVVFQYNLNNGNYKVLYNFCPSLFMGHCRGGDAPSGKLIIDGDGNLYGTTQLGGPADAGSVYELVKPATSGGSWSYSQVYTFCSLGGCVDGNDPYSGLTYSGAASGADYDGTSLLFGETLAGGFGGTQGSGGVYALQPVVGSTWSEKVIHDFCTCTTDGLEPGGGLYMDASDNLWGTTFLGGSDGNGIAFELAHGTDEWNDPWTRTVLYNFCWTNVTKCPDGAEPNGVTMDASGNLFGTTMNGGNGSATVGNGVVFKLTNGSCTEGGTATFWCNTVKYNFCHVSGCTDGSNANGDIVIDGSGNIFGTTSNGGSTAVVTQGAGVTWELTGTTETVLHTFCTSSCSDGSNPYAGVITDSSGNLYGNTNFGGANSGGVLWEFTP